MIVFAFTFISSILVYSMFPYFPVLLSILSIAVVCFPAYDSCRVNFTARRFRILIIVIYVSGLAYSFARHEELPQINFPDEDLKVEGTVSDVPEFSNERIRFTVDRVLINGKLVEGKIRLNMSADSFYRHNAEVLLVPGYRVSAIAGIREPVPYRNPGVSSYELRNDGIIATGYIKQLRLLNTENGLSIKVNKFRQRTGSIMDRSLSEESASLLRAIIPGLKRNINQDIRDAFSATGLAHLLSISGTHFALLAFIIFKSVRMIIKSLPAGLLSRMTLYLTPTQAAVIFTLPVLLAYALVSGASTPTVRSLIIIVIYMLALFLGRKEQWLNSLSIAAIIILLLDPDALFELSFQLSFLAVLSIGLVLERMAKDTEHSSQTLHVEQPGQYNKAVGGWFRKIIEKSKTGILITIAAVLGTAPLAVLYFKQFPLISPLTNLAVTPIVCFVILPLGFFSTFCSLIFDLSVMPAGSLIDLITLYVVKLIRIFATIPYSSVHLHNPPFVLTVFYFLSLFFLVKSSSRWRYVPFAIVVAVYLTIPYINNDRLAVTFLDVGQGDASVIRLPDKKVMLIDGGRSKPDAGRSVIAPYLWSHAINRVDYLVVSHLHSDHFGGLLYVMENFDIGEVWLNGRMPLEGEEFISKANKKRIPARVLRRGDMLDAGDYRVYILHPYDKFYADSPRGEFSDINSDSLVIRIEAEDVSFLFTGDIEAEAEENLIHLGKWLKSDILKIPHHGGSTSSTGNFIKAVTPGLGVVSAGRYNHFRHPHQQTLERYRNAGVPLFRTDEDGAVSVFVKKGSYEVETYDDSKFKKVESWRDELRNLKLLISLTP